MKTLLGIVLQCKGWAALSLFPIILLSSTVVVKDAERLLQQGHAAFARGDYAGAAADYQQAELYTTEPARAAFYLAGAKYQLAVRTKGPSPQLAEAEKLYRCCLNPRDPHRPYALYGLGNCLLRKSGIGNADSLRTAIACYDEYLRTAGDNDELSADALYNREMARLRLQQLQPPPRSARGDQPPNEGPNPHSPQPDQRQGMPASLGEQNSEDGEGARAVEDAAKQKEGASATKKDAPFSPGKGNLDPVPDEMDVPPLSPSIAAEHLEIAARKILHERRVFHRRGERTSTVNVKDW